jgi:hypothetical protein
VNDSKSNVIDGKVHVVPTGPQEPKHEESGECICEPVFQDGIWIHYRLVGNELAEHE